MKIRPLDDASSVDYYQIRPQMRGFLRPHVYFKQRPVFPVSLNFHVVLKIMRYADISEKNQKSQRVRPKIEHL
jgi:hypothetical protein